MKVRNITKCRSSFHCVSDLILCIWHTTCVLDMMHCVMDMMLNCVMDTAKLCNGQCVMSNAKINSVMGNGICDNSV